jgi:Fic family protein
MSELPLLIEKISSLKTELDKLMPLKIEDQQRLDKKFRLEWSYNSNHIEGNTLTYAQTEYFLMLGKTTGDHEMREYEEMQAHDVAVKLVSEYANDKTRDLTEADVRQWNKIILVKPYWGTAQTSDGQPTRKLIQPGEYKKEPNSVRLQNGEMFHYASPEETPAKMNELMAWLRKVSEEKKLHPVQIAAQLHYDFVRIHPFDDSNGRTSRLLMNYVLLRNDYPPVIIKTADKKGYLNALNKADVGDLKAFVEYVAKQLIWSLEINLKAARGESIEEEDDLYKEIDVWKRGFSSTNKEAIKSIKIVTDLFYNVLRKLIEEYLTKQKESFDDLFVLNNTSLEADDENTVGGYVTMPDFEGLLIRYSRFNKDAFDSRHFNTWKIIYSREILKDASKRMNIKIKSTLKIDFLPLTYEIAYNDLQLIRNPYNKYLTDKDIRDIVKECIKNTFEEINRLSSY